MKKEKMEKARKYISLISLIMLVSAAVCYYCGLSYYKLLLAVATPLCIITVYLELAKSQKGKKTILLPLFFAFFVLSSVTPLVEAGRIYQGHGSTTYIYPYLR